MNELQEALRFTDADLKANTEGQLSQKQREQFRERQVRSLQFLRGVALVVVALLIVALVLSDGMGLIVSGTLALILAVMALMEYMVGYQTYHRDLSSREIETIQGMVHYIWRGDSALGIETRPAGIRIGDVQFLLMEDQARAFIEGDIYALNYAPATHTFLSAERIILTEGLADDAEVAYLDMEVKRSYRDRESG